MMYKISALLASKINAHVIINGESVGQVASQTLTSMYVINNVTSMPVIRPVACLDKLEIIDKQTTYTGRIPYVSEKSQSSSSLSFIPLPVFFLYILILQQI